MLQLKAGCLETTHITGKYYKSCQSLAMSPYPLGGQAGIDGKLKFVENPLNDIQTDFDKHHKEFHFFFVSPANHLKF